MYFEGEQREVERMSKDVIELSDGTVIDLRCQHCGRNHDNDSLPNPYAAAAEAMSTMTVGDLLERKARRKGRE